MRIKITPFTLSPAHFERLELNKIKLLFFSWEATKEMLKKKEEEEEKESEVSLESGAGKYSVYATKNIIHWIDVIHWKHSFYGSMEAIFFSERINKTKNF